MAAHESTTAKSSPITDGVHCPQKRLWLLVLPTAFFPSARSLTSHKISFAALPVSDCESTPFALRPQHGTPGLPGNTLKFVWGWWWCPGTACYFPLHAPPYSVSSQKIWVLILRGKNTECFYNFAPEFIVFNEQTSIARFDWRPDPCFYCPRGLLFLNNVCVNCVYGLVGCGHLDLVHLHFAVSTRNSFISDPTCLPTSSEVGRQSFQLR
jgi:hypothetical protein